LGRNGCRQKEAFKWPQELDVRYAGNAPREVRMNGPKRATGKPSKVLITALVVSVMLLVGLPLILFAYVITRVDRMLLPGH
jgi:hypothetical protein